MAGLPVRKLAACCAASRSARAICEKSRRNSPTAIIIATLITAKAPSWHLKITREHLDRQEPTSATKSANIGSTQSHSTTVSARAISALQDVPRRRFVGSDRQACHQEAGFVALAVDFALVVLSSEVDGDREFRLAFQDLGSVRGSCDRVAHLRERGGEESMMRVVRPCDPREGIGCFGVFFSAIAGAPEMAPEALRVVGIEAHRLLDPIDALLRPPKPR